MRPTAMTVDARDGDDRWALRAGDRTLLGNKSGTTRLGFAVLLKVFQAEGRFPRRPEDVPVAAVEAVALSSASPPPRAPRRLTTQSAGEPPNRVNSNSTLRALAAHVRLAASRKPPRGASGPRQRKGYVSRAELPRVSTARLLAAEQQRRGQRAP